MKPRVIVLAALAAWMVAPARAGDTVDLVRSPFALDTGLESRSISFENPTGARGAGGKTSSNLGPGRKGYPARDMKPGETVTLCDIDGPGTIRRIWITTAQDPEILRSLVVRAWWDGQAHPSIECPLGDFMGFAHGKVVGYQSAVHSVGRMAGMNLWLPAPFPKHVKMTFSNEGKKASPLYYQIEYTLGDRHAADVGRLHVLFRRENPTTLKQDFELLPRRAGKGRFIGSIMGIRSLDTTAWWGEGEFKVYRDGDTDHPTICGTGSEDYIGLSWGTQETPYQYNGCSLDRQGFVSMYRWHLPDPIFWSKECRVTIQQIGADAPRGLFERTDDWSCASFWYEPVPSAPLPKFPSVEQRTKDLWKEPPARR